MSPAEATTAIEGGVLEGSGAASGVPSKRKQATGDKVSPHRLPRYIHHVGRASQSQGHPSNSSRVEMTTLLKVLHVPPRASPNS